MLVTVTLVGCSSTKEQKNKTQNKTTSQQQTVDTAAYDKGYLEVTEEESKNMQKMFCTREATGKEKAQVNLNYTLYYQGEYLQVLHSKEQIVTENQEVLDEYQIAYINIYKNYENLEYYNTSVVRKENSVTNDTIIQYNKLDTEKLLEIEGEEDNIIKDGKVKVSDWVEFAEQLGTKCEKD